MESGGASLVFPLFLDGGFIHTVDDLLQLGRDLAEFPDWRSRTKLVGELRSMRGWSGARFEVGVQAGLRRVGLLPVVEPADSKDETRPDFVVDADGLCVGIELKSLADPDYTRNRNSLCDLLARRLYPLLGDNWRGDVTLELSDEAVEQLNTPRDAFDEHFIPLVDRELQDAVEKARLNTRITLPSIGELTMAYPRWDAPHSFAGSYGVRPDDIDSHHLLNRALRRARVASGQLEGADVDLRVAVIWGSRSLLPAEGAARIAQEQILDEYDARWATVPLDWIVFFNAHMLGEDGRWTTNIGICKVPHARADIPPTILEGLTAWGRWRR